MRVGGNDPRNTADDARGWIRELSGNFWVAIAVLAGFVVGFFLFSRPAVEVTVPHREIQQVPAPANDASAKGAPVAPRRDSGRAPLAPPGVPEDAIPGEVVLRFSDAAKFNDFLKQAREAGIELRGVVPALNAVRLGADDYAKLEDVDAVLDYNYLVSAPEIPSSRSPDGREYANFGTSAMQWLGADAAQLAWGRDVTIAILDSGVDPASPVAQRLLARIDLIGSGNGGEFVGHGTAIATLLAGEEGRIDGVASGANLLSIRVLGDDGFGDSFTLARGIVEAVDRGARVLSLSLGSFSDSQVVRDAVAYAQERNAVIVAAAGNEAANSIVYPARYDGVIAVTAVDANRLVPYFGNQGAEVDLAAPGVGVVTRWDQATQVSFTGTSAAVPFVSGAIAGVMSQNPGLSAAQAAQILIQYSDDAGAPGSDAVYGAGILDLQRVAERNRPGISRLSIASQYLDNARATVDAVPLTATVQNRGTTTLYGVTLNTSVNGRTEQVFIPQLAPGATAAQTVAITRAASVGTPVKVTSWASSGGTTAAPISVAVRFSNP